MMLLQKRIFTLVLLLVTGLFVLPTSVIAGDIAVPTVPKASKKANEKTLCVRPVEDMRKNHMDYMLHQRDKTMHDGIRTKKDSLAECVDCHVAPDEKGNYANYGDDKHFCSTCHNYASVQIDCFECHRDKPRNVDYKHSMVDKSLAEKYRLHISITQQNKNSQLGPELDRETLDILSRSEGVQQ